MTYPLPSAALDDRLAIVGTAGSGKTYSAGTAVERLLRRGARVVIVDPLDVWYGLRLAANGRDAAYPVVIFGGEHGDLPINEHAGALIGETVAGMSESCIVSLGGLGTKAAERRFMLAFLTALYRHQSGGLLHLVIDEADMFAPQRLLDKDGDAAKMLGQMETIVRRGRRLGFIPWLITQRPAVLSKDVLSQADGLIALKLTSSQDRDAIGAWIEGQADKQEGRTILASLPKMQRGEGVVWIPGRDVLVTAKFPLKTTFDSSRAPKRGEAKPNAELRALDVTSLRDKLAAVEQEAKANDPKALRSEIARLKAEAQRASPSIDPAAIEAAEQRGYERGSKDGIEAANRSSAALIKAALEQLRTPAQSLVTSIDQAFEAALRNLSTAPAPVLQPRTPRPMPQPSVRPAAPAREVGSDELTRPQRKIIDALNLWLSLGHKQPSREMIAVVAGYSPSSGGFNNLIGQLRTSGKVDLPAPGLVSLAESEVGEPMSVDTARNALLAVLSAPQRKLVGAMSGTAVVSREALAAATDYSASSGGFNNLISSLCTLGVMTKPMPGHVALSEWAAELLT